MSNAPWAVWARRACKRARAREGEGGLHLFWSAKMLRVVAQVGPICEVDCDRHARDQPYPTVLVWWSLIGHAGARAQLPAPAR
eukprot:6271069-Prymnesium_polylepis.1